jgi:hypothetical protein
VFLRQSLRQHFVLGRPDGADAVCHDIAQLSESTFLRMPRRIKRFVASIILITAFWAIGCSFAFAQCQAITSSHPRLYLPNSAYGSYSTVKDRLNAARLANSPEWQAIYNEATPYLTTEIASYYYDSMAFEMAMMYAIDPADYQAYGVRSLHFLAEAQQFLAPTVDITAATNGNPTVFTTASAHGLSTGTYIAPVWGGTGNWAALNQANAYKITVVNATHFSVAIDSTSFGPLTGKMTVTNTNEFTELNQARWNTPDMAATWDWAHPLIAGNLTADQINMIENVMTAAITFVATNPYEFIGSTPYPTGGIGNLTIGPMSGALQMAVALSGEVPGMNTICNELRATFLQVAPIYTTGTARSGYVIYPFAYGGAHVESMEYAPETEFFLMTYLQTMRGATGENLYSQIGTFPTALLQFQFEDTSPGTASSGGSLGEQFGYGDIIFADQHQFNWVDRQVVEQLAYYLCSSGDTTHCNYAEWWLQNIYSEAQLNARGNGTVAPLLNRPNEFLWYDPAITATNPEGSAYSTDYLADGYSIMLSRSAWSSSATWVLFKGGGLQGFDEDHWHPDVLTFSLYRNGDWLTNELMSWNPAKMTRFYNVPLPETDMLGTVYEGSNSPSGMISILDWGTLGMTKPSQITQYESNTSLNYAYVEADASQVYRGQSNPNVSPAYTATVNTVIRDFLYLKPDTYVVEDRLAYDSALQSEWNLQALSNPGTPSGNTFALGSLLGNNALNVAVISPASPSYTVIPPATQAMELNSNGGSGCPNGVGASCASQWRIEITSGKTVTSEQYFVVMQSGASGFIPLAVTRLSATNAIAAQFGGYVVMGLTDTSQTGVTRSYTYIPNTTIQHVGMGFKPSTAYSVDRSVPSTVTISNGTGGANDITTTSGGVLLFTTGSSVQGPLSPPTIRPITVQ